MRCETFLDRYDLLDSGEEAGPLLKLHLAHCDRCRAQVETLDLAVKGYRESVMAEDSATGPESDRFEDRVMAAARLMPRPRRELHARDWVVSGVILVAALALVPYDGSFSVIKELFGVGYSLPLALVMAMAPTIFGAVFIATHIGELEPMLKRHLHRS